MLDETQLSESEIRKQNLLMAYQNPDNVTLYRYENANIPYDESREGKVSKQDLVGGWFTSDMKDFTTYVKRRQPGGRIVVIRIPKTDLPKYDATVLEATKDMDIEPNNYVVSPEDQSPTRLELSLPVASTNPKQFAFSSWKEIDDFIDKNLTQEKLLEKAKQL